MRVVSCLAAFVVFITSVELTSPAETTTIENSPVIEENYAVEESCIGEENNGEPVAELVREPSEPAEEYFAAAEEGDCGCG